MSKAKVKGKTAAKSSWVKDTLVIVISALVLALLIKTFLFDSRVIPSTSMLPTIEISDRVIVSKLSYIGQREPQRGDIIVFEPPAELKETSDLIKRVIGLPGETLEIRDGTVYVDGTALSEDYVLEQCQYDYGPVTVPEGKYFVMGDNRNNSKDSHMWNDPFLDATAIVGRATFCYWPLSRIGVLR